MNKRFTDEQWNTIQLFDANGQSEPKYTTADKITALFSGAVMLYLIIQLLRGAF